MMQVVLKPVETALFTSDLVLLAEYHCRVDDPLFVNSGPSNAHSIVFPLTSTRIRRERSVTIEIPNVVALYNEGAEYSREAVSLEGSHCAWMTLDPEVLSELLTRDGGNGAVPGKPFSLDQVAADRSLFLRQRRLFEYVHQFGAADPLLVEDESLAIVDQIAANIRSSSRQRARRHSRSVVERARSLVAARFADTISLGGIAREIGVSAAYLSRAFRQTTGQTMHSFREELRLLRALDLLPDSRGDFTRIALDLGYSSHSHFTSRFRRHFGVTPSDFAATPQLHASIDRASAASLAACSPPL